MCPNEIECPEWNANDEIAALTFDERQTEKVVKDLALL